MADPPVPGAAPAAGKVVMRSPEGKLYEVAPGDVGRQQVDLGWSVAGETEVGARVAEREQFAQYGGAGQQALAAGETALRTATLGVVPGFGAPADIAGRTAVLREDSPVTSFLAQAAGTVLPALAGGALGGAAAGAAGLSGRAAAAVGVLAEGAAAGTADEVEEARAQGRAMTAGNILVNGIGGEIFGRALPAVLRKGVSAVRSRVAGEAVEAAGEGVLASAERKALESAADVADGVPLGPDRDVFLVNAEKEIAITGATRLAQSLDTLSADMAETTSEGMGKRAKVRRMVSETHPEQRQWAADTSQGALDLREQLRPRKPATNPEPLPDGTLPAPVAPRGDFSAVPGLAKPAKELDRILTEGSKRLDEASAGADWFEVSGDIERSLHAQEKAIQKALRSADPLDQAAGDEMLSQVSTYRQRLRADRERGDLWGGAADFQKGLNTALEDHWRPGASHIEGKFSAGVEGSTRFDAGKLRGHLAADEVGRGVTPEFLQKQLAGAEQAIATHRKFGTASDAQLSRMQKSIDSIREQVKLSDDVRGAKARYSESEGLRRESAKFDKEQAGALREKQAGRGIRDDLKDEAIGAVAGAAAGYLADSFGLGAAVAMGSKALRLTRLLGTLGRTGEASIATAARGAVRGSPARALRAAEGALSHAGKVGVPLATTAISRFQGEYPSIQAAFEAKKRTLESVARDPLSMHRAIGQSLGQLNDVRPDLHGEISARLAVMAQYLYENMPSQLSASMTRPNGVPLSRATARDFALKYNSVTDPSSVLADIRDGSASPTQLRALESVHPDIYQGLRVALAREVAEEPQMTTQRKLRLDILFGGDGTAGRAYGWPLAMAIKERRAARAQGARSAANMSGGSSAAKNAPIARGTTAIKNSVTNA